MRQKLRLIRWKQSFVNKLNENNEKEEPAYGLVLGEGLSFTFGSGGVYPALTGLGLQTHTSQKKTATLSGKKYIIYGPSRINCFNRQSESLFITAIRLWSQLNHRMSIGYTVLVNKVYFEIKVMIDG
jgi:hypothetical protein